MSIIPEIYRVYRFDLDRKMVTAELIKAADDAEAIAKLEMAGFGTKCEVWHGRRLVAELEGERRQA